MLEIDLLERIGPPEPSEPKARIALWHHDDDYFECYYMNAWRWRDEMNVNTLNSTVRFDRPSCRVDQKTGVGKVPSALPTPFFQIKKY